MFCYSTSHPSTSQLFPYTTLFRSRSGDDPHPAPTRKDPREASRALSDEQRGVVAQGGGNLEQGLGPSGMLDGLRIRDRKSTRLNSSHLGISYAVFCLKKKRTEVIAHYGTIYGTRVPANGTMGDTHTALQPKQPNT